MIRMVAGLCILLLASLKVMGVKQQDSVLNRIVSVHAVQLPVSSILRNISDDQQIYFSYDASLVNTERILTIHLENIRLLEALTQIFPHGEFRFLQKEDYIIITAFADVQDFLHDHTLGDDKPFRSEERRVGKEC